MVLDAFNLLVFTGKLIFGSSGIPGTPFYESFFGELAYFILIGITLASAHYLEEKFALALLAVTAGIAMVFGGAYVMFLTVIFLLPWFFVVRWFTGAPDYFEEAEQQLPKKEEPAYPAQPYVPPIQYAPPVKKESISEKYSFFKK
jgi:hypothetical protein